MQGYSLGEGDRGDVLGLQGFGRAEKCCLASRYRWRKLNEGQTIRVSRGSMGFTRVVLGSLSTIGPTGLGSEA